MHHSPIFCFSQMVIQLELNAMCGQLLIILSYKLPHLILLCMYPLAHHSTHHIVALHYLVLIAHFLPCMCVWFFSIDAGTEEYAEEYDYYPEEDRAGLSSSDLTGEPLPFTYFTFCSRSYFLALSCVLVTCPITCYLLQAIHLPPSYNYCLVIGVSLASRRHAQDRCYILLPLSLSSGVICWGSEIHVYGYICWSFSRHTLFLLITKMLSRGIGGSAVSGFNHDSLVSTIIS